ncbi:MAG: TetR/AcrR family transcriptional regulator [Erysipelotrichia bacterium]|nr:TetR/AcrR family transcriptional regulator [Erysipelotrichia bacterium]
MPKIIENIREQLLIEAKKQVLQQGYSKTTMRSVAKGCSVGVGTLYNYFDSKEMLVATFVLEDWNDYLKMMGNLYFKDAKTYLQGIYMLLCDFEEKYKSLFSDKEAAKSIGTVFYSRHRQLRKQIAGFVGNICKGDNSLFTAEFIAENLLCWSMEKIDFEMIYLLLDKIIKEEN